MHELVWERNSLQLEYFILFKNFSKHNRVRQTKVKEINIQNRDLERISLYT